MFQIVLISLLVWFVVLRWKDRKMRAVATYMRSDFQHLPFVGQAHHLMGTGEVRMTVIQALGRHAIENNGWSSVQLGSTFYGLVADAVETEYVMKAHLEKGDVLKVTQGLLGNGLIFAPVSIWRPRRKVLAPTFSQYNLTQFVNIFNKQSRIMLGNLSQVADKGTFSIWKYLTSYTMDSVCNTTLGIDIGAQTSEQQHQFLRCFQEFATIISKRLCCPWLHNETSFKYLCYYGMYTRYKKCLDILKAFVFDIIGKKRAELKKKQSFDGLNNNQDNGKQKFRPILELLIEASGGEKGYTDSELQEETQVILGAGTDTSAVGASFISVMLAKHPHIQEKVYKEIQEVFGGSDRPIRADDLSRLTYLEVVVKETLRLYPPVPITARKIVKEGVTPSGVVLPVGMGVIICHWAIHRHPKYWGKDAEVFRPERFLENYPTHPAAFVPFSGGPRNCLGYKYAMMSMMTVVTTLLRRYRILPSDQEEADKPLRMSFEVMMKDADNFQLKLQSRK